MRPLAATALCLCLAGCTGNLFKSNQPAATVYALDVPQAPALTPQSEAVLIVPRAFAAPGIETDRVLVQLPGQRVEAYSGVRLSAPVPELVQSLLIESLRARGGFRAVLPERAEFAGEYLLQLEVREFQATYASADAPPLVRVRLQGELGRPRSAELLASLSGNGEATASANRQSAVMAAFDSALADALKELGSAVHGTLLKAEQPAH